jgi:hypothetical protein
MSEQSTWRPITITEKSTGRSVNITILEREMYLTGLFTFEDIWNIYETEAVTESPAHTD